MVITPVGAGFYDLLRGEWATPSGTPTLGLARPRKPYNDVFQGVDIGGRTSQDYFTFDFNPGFSDHEAITLAGLYAGSDAQTVVRGQLFGFGVIADSSLIQQMQVSTSNEAITHIANGSARRATATSSVLYDTGDKNSALIGGNFYPVQQGDSAWIDVWVDGVREAQDNFDLRGGEASFDRFAIGVPVDDLDTNGGGSGTLSLILVYKGRNLTANEWESLSRNPWQIFQPLTQIIPSFVDGAPPSVVLNQLQQSNLGADMYNGTLQ